MVLEPLGSWESTLLSRSNIILQVWLMMREAVEIGEEMIEEECFHRKISGHAQEVPTELI